ncbi:MAG: hypothetical protein CMQ46_04655 [Gammaproteobacteria bacterium]|nr:hypothetical protein [Gammaproteobacteria bacterium]MBJ54539.1 hypothetical protein [Gammaproteobacteria bacterium]HBN14528.1 hypothetical protein [Pseudohongiella sp.]
MKRLLSLTSLLTVLMTVLLFSATALGQQARVETQLDRTELVRGETVTLTVRVHGQQGGVQIDLEPLRDSFEVVSTRSASHLRSVNNRIESWTDYRLVLFPRNLGEQEIPPIAVAGEQTPSYTITVTEPTGTGPGNGQDVFMETVLSKDSIYVQEQLLYTIRLYYTIAGIRNPNFTEVAPEGAVVQTLGPPHQYERLIDGTRYGVYEINYVIFPQRSGELEIPDIVFRGELTDGSSNFVFRNPNMRPITAFADGYTVEVKERPAGFPENTWLPAQNIQITENWSRDITTMQPGDSVRRTITVVASGLDGAALPPLSQNEIEGMNVYPEPADIERTVIDGNVVGTRVESYELVATEAGSVVIPEINLPWWDTDEDEQREAVIPSSFIRIAPVGGVTEEAVEAGQEGSDLTLASLDSLQDELISEVQTPAWILNLMALVIVVVLGMMWWLWRRQQQRNEQTEVPVIHKTEAYASDIEDGQEKQAFTELSSRLKNADAQQIRLQLIAWGRQYFMDAGLYNLDDLAARLNSADIRDAFTQLQASLYSGNSGKDAYTSEQRQQLQDLLTRYRDQHAQQRRAERQAAPYALPPLYRN